MKFNQLLKSTVILSGLSLLLAACGNSGDAGSADSGQANSADSEGKTELVFWHGMGGETEKALDELVADFNNSQDEVFVNAQYQGTYDETLTKLRSSASGEAVGADLVQVFEQGTAFMIDSGLTVPVQEYVDKNNSDLSQLEPNLLAYYSLDDQLHSMPFNSSTPILYYNKDVLEKAGMSEAPSNMEEIFENADKLTEQESVTMPISVGVYGWYIEQWINKMGEDMFNNGNGRESAPTEVVFDDNGSMERVLEMWNEGEEKGYMPNVGREGGQPEFVSGQSAMTVGSTANLRQILTEVNDRFEVGTAYYPGLTAEDDQGVSIGGASLWMIDSGDDAKKDATWKFIEYLVSPKVQAKWNAATGYFPVNLNSHEEEEFKKNLEEFPQFETAINQLHDSEPSDQGAISGVNQEARQIYEAELESLLNGSDAPADAVKRMADQTNSALENYNKVNK
ncbi:ABC transporter substrate-binding protein [Aerococcus sanguinicola]|uniref:ABC transporter substrate-binding protein n=1 Tax=Aerococcus sanguinicola TaxID=119206 RepID=UPI0025502D35|nr:ABC transporter substrate-binding protein [Aerococcus sanguinicola]MDK7049763.1 ABC transporter substrate-binding protein [Aerococcus sanguinicola]